MTMATLALFGKHPGLGDFVQRGLTADEAQGLAGWLDPCLAAARAQAGDDWEALWDSARGLRFWWGRVLTGRTVAGILLPSRDKVGRRYPLILSLGGAAVPSPMAATDQRLWQRMEALTERLEPGGGGLSGLAPDMLGLDDLGIADEPPEALRDGAVVWAHRPGGNVVALLEEARPVDACRAATARTYWWHPGRDGGPAAFLGLNGWPDAGALCWLLASGRPAAELAPAHEEPAAEGAAADASD